VIDAASAARIAAFSLDPTAPAARGVGLDGTTAWAVRIDFKLARPVLAVAYLICNQSPPVGQPRQPDDLRGGGNLSFHDSATGLQAQCSPTVEAARGPPASTTWSGMRWNCPAKVHGELVLTTGPPCWAWPATGRPAIPCQPDSFAKLLAGPHLHGRAATLRQVHLAFGGPAAAQPLAAGKAWRHTAQLTSAPRSPHHHVLR